jgi:hypothetical protein
LSDSSEDSDREDPLLPWLVIPTKL